MIVVLAIDALEYEKVKEFDCTNLMQESYGKTDISEFSQPRTMVLWSSFATGQNKENEVLADGNKEMWNKKWKLEETFFSKFNAPLVLDLPGYSYNLEAHEKSRKMLRQFFETEINEEKENIRKEYNKDAFDHHRKIKKQFLEALEKEYDFVLGYFSVGDVIGHLNFGNKILMKMIYKDFDELAQLVRSKGHKLLILSDHGMEALGVFGDHSNYGFWSLNFGCELEEPKITQFGEVLTKDL